MPFKTSITQAHRRRHSGTADVFTRSHSQGPAGRRQDPGGQQHQADPAANPMTHRAGEAPRERKNNHEQAAIMWTASQRCRPLPPSHCPATPLAPAPRGSLPLPPSVRSPEACRPPSCLVCPETATAASLRPNRQRRARQCVASRPRRRSPRRGRCGRGRNPCSTETRRRGARGGGCGGVDGSGRRRGRPGGLYPRLPARARDSPWPRRTPRPSARARTARPSAPPPGRTSRAPPPCRRRPSRPCARSRSRGGRAGS
mmetsp:Transcript_176/g.455  ORF Transcript_176/g.455 Transcript_176/m.455 type:complete len:257 (-) Transcript_176:88-858(-)